ncbi:hypothetical protein SMGD1_1589 [Sulfurimonas gotlandica GD1]|jgi:hypothetical protein|uniref:Uncharacterized protein n=1 Tax=Sulfurimonas gotlandica (strain DSM 19862 / JCM 16533 / GD1) TaxID=929558 RepID=H1FUG1_SULGG|nr:hypothetical protein [Sulfurimonas gotlandica]EHP30113.1 hypothetical protein SMGD1_1589 [Sulfurimonas gotlandica GD1]
MSRYKLITCILTKPVAIEMITRLKEEKGIITANTTHARGTSSKSEYMMKAEEILTVLVDASEADDIFYFLYSELELDQPHQGMIYQEAVAKSTKYSLPDLSSSV